MRDLKFYLEEYKRRSRMIQQESLERLVPESSEAQEQRVKELLKPENYARFFEYYFGAGAGEPLATSKCANFHIEQSQELVAMRVLNQFRLLFRGAAKSVHSNIGNPLLLKQLGEIHFGLIVGRNEDRAKLLLADLQMQLESNELIIKDFGKQESYGSWTQGEFMTRDGCYFMGLGIEQPFRGLRKHSHRLDYAVVDDVEDLKKVKNENLIKEYVGKITSDLVGAFDMERRRLIVANNYISKRGIVQGLLDKLGKSIYTRLHQVNIVDAQGFPTWKERYTADSVQAIKESTDPYSYEREYMNNPQEEGALFKEIWLKEEINPEHYQYRGYLGHWDLSYKVEGDYKAYALVGLTQNELHLLDVFCRKCSLTEALDWHYQSAKAHGLPVLNYYDATAAQQAVFEPELTAASIRNLSPAVPMPNLSQHVDKHLRIEATLVPAFFSKALKVSRNLKNNPDWERAKIQLLSFEKGTKAHDDFPDTLENAVRLAYQLFGRNSEQYRLERPIIGRRTVNSDF